MIRYLSTRSETLPEDTRLHFITYLRSPAGIGALLRAFLLWFILHLHDIIDRYPFQNARSFVNHIHDLCADIALHDNLILALQILRYRGTSSKLLCKLFRSFLEIDVYNTQSNGR